MRNYIFFILFCFISFSSKIIYGQSKSSNLAPQYRYWLMDESITSLYKLAPVTNELNQLGITTNPGLSNNSYIKEMACYDCDPVAIRQAFVQVLQYDEAVNVNLGMIVLDFNDEKSVLYHLSRIERLDYHRYYHYKNQLIFLWNDHEDVTKVNIFFKKMNDFLKNKGATFHDVSIKDQNITDEEILESIELSKNVKQEPIATNKNRKIKYLYVSEGGMIVCYSDGTVNVCDECHPCEQTLQDVANQQPYTLYLDDAKGLYIQSVERDITEPLFLPFHDNKKYKEWYIKDFKNIIPLEYCK